MQGAGQACDLLRQESALAAAHRREPRVVPHKGGERGCHRSVEQDGGASNLDLVHQSSKAVGTLNLHVGKTMDT